jgi:hypothetical protein
LKADLKLKAEILRQIKLEGRDASPLEDKMLKSISNSFKVAELDEVSITSVKKLPDLATRMQGVGLHKSLYVAVQNMGSHAVHGRLADLLKHYLVETEPSIFVPNLESTPTFENQYIVTSYVMCCCFIAFVNWRLNNGEAKTALVERLTSSNNELLRQAGLFWRFSDKKVSDNQ